MKNRVMEIIIVLLLIPIVILFNVGELIAKKIFKKSFIRKVY